MTVVGNQMTVKMGNSIDPTRLQGGLGLLLKPPFPFLCWIRLHLVAV